MEGYLFVAANLQAMPSYGPEEINLAVVADRQVKMDAAIKNISSSMHMNSLTITQQVSQSVVQDIQQHLDRFKDDIGARLDHMSTVCNQLAQNAAARSNVIVAAPSAARQSRDFDRSMNLLMFGVEEDKVASVWRDKADRALEFIAGNPVDVTDMFRLGRFNAGKTRPILVKLRTTWDKRIILINCHKLKDYTESIFIAPDEPLEERRKKRWNVLNIGLKKMASLFLSIAVSCLLTMYKYFH
jgi:hypothetical protein